MRKILSEKFFENRNTVKIAKSLLGKMLLRRLRVGVRAYLITQVEAYDGFRDKASHAHRGKTERNKIMFGEAGHWYVYFTYGIHWLLNIVTGPKEYPAAILIRAVESPFSRYRSSAQRADSLGFVARSPHFVRNPARSLLGPRYVERAFSSEYFSINGPARLTKFLKIDGKLNGLPASKKSGLWIEDWGVRIPAKEIKSSPRIGVDYAGPVWSKKKMRFRLVIEK